MAADITLSGWSGLDTDTQEFLGDLQRFLDREQPDRAALRSWDRELVEAAAALGLQGMLVDDDLQLVEDRVLAAVAASEVVAARAPALAMAIGCARIHSIVLTRYATDALRERWLERVCAADAIGSMAISEADAGTDVRGIRTVARRVDGGWQLNGEKAWVTLGPVADFSIVLAKIDTTGRDADMGIFVVERGFGGVTYGAEESFRAFSGVPVGGLSLQDVSVPDTHVVAESGGFGRALAAVNYARLEAACLGVGILRGCAELTAEYAKQREVAGKPIAEQQAVQLAIGRTLTDLEAARSLLYRTAGDGLDEVEPARFAVTKAFATEAALAAASRAVSVQGATGLLDDGPAMQLLQEAKATQIFDGTTDVLLMTAAKAVTRR